MRCSSATRSAHCRLEREPRRHDPRGDAGDGGDGDRGVQGLHGRRYGARLPAHAGNRHSRPRRAARIFETVGPTGLPLMVHPHDQGLMAPSRTGSGTRGERDFRAYARAYAAHDGIIWDTADGDAAPDPAGHRHPAPPAPHPDARRRRAPPSREGRRPGVSRPRSTRGRCSSATSGRTIERLGSYALSYWVPEENTEPLWEALRDGTIDLFSTDHAPAHSRGEGARLDGWVEGTHRNAVDPVLRPTSPRCRTRRSPHARARRGNHVERTGASLRPWQQGPSGGRCRCRPGDRRPRPRPRDPRRRGALEDRLDTLRRAHGAGSRRDDDRARAGRLRDGRVVGRPGWGKQASPSRDARGDAHRRRSRRYDDGDEIRAAGAPLRRASRPGSARWRGRGCAEELGFDSLWVRDHLVFHPHGMEGSDRTFIEPFVTLSFVAGVTRSIGLGAATIIPPPSDLPGHSVASLSWISRRPFDLGIGAGNFQHEFDVIGQGDVDRPRADARADAGRARLWSGERSSGTASGTTSMTSTSSRSR